MHSFAERRLDRDHAAELGGENTDRGLPGLAYPTPRGLVVPDIVSRAPTSAVTVVTRLAERRGTDLWGLARRLDLSAEEAADVVQETLFRLWRELMAGTEVVDPDAWAFRVVYRLGVDQHRFRRQVRGLVERVAFVAAHPVARDPTDALAVWTEVDRLPPRQRAVLYLHYRADLPYEAVGAVMGITANGARNHASAAMARLRRAFDRFDGDAPWT